MDILTRLFRPHKAKANNRDKIDEKDLKIVDKDSFYKYVNKQIQLREQATNFVYDSVNESLSRKIEELGLEAAVQWASAEIEKAKEATFVKIRSSDMQYCEQRFFRITKSSTAIASASAEGHPFIPSVPGQVSSDIYGAYGLCFVPECNIIGYLGYGDELTEINFDRKALANVGLSEEIVIYTPHKDKEYRAFNLLVKTKESLMLPGTLKKVIKCSDNESFRKALISQDILRFDDYFKKFGLNDTACAWRNIMECARSLGKLNDEALNFLRTNIDEIIPEFTLDDIVAKLKDENNSSLIELNRFTQSEEER